MLETKLVFHFIGGGSGGGGGGGGSDGSDGGKSTIAYMSVLVMAAVVVMVVDIHDGSLTAGMSVLVMMMAVVDTHDGSVDTVDWPLQLCMNLAVVVAAAAGNTLLVDVENAPCCSGSCFLLMCLVKS